MPDKMKKRTFIILVIGFIIECIGLAFLLYGINNGKTYYWIGSMMSILGLIIAAVSLLILGVSKSKKGSD